MIKVLFRNTFNTLNQHVVNVLVESSVNGSFRVVCEFLNSRTFYMYYGDTNSTNGNITSDIILGWVFGLALFH